MSGTITMTSDELADLIRRLHKQDGWLTVKEAAAYLRTSIQTVYGWVKEGRVPAYAPVKGTRLLRRSDLDALCRRSHVDPEEMTLSGKKGAEHLTRWHESRRTGGENQQEQETAR